MTLTNNTKIVALALTAALLGGTIGAVVEHSESKKLNTVASANSAPVAEQTAGAQNADNNALTSDSNTSSKDATGSSESLDTNTPTQAQNNTLVATSTSTTRSRRVEPVRASTSSRYASRTSRSVYRSHETSRPVSSWERHRNILTVALGTGGGALLGGLIGGRKGTAIGALAGAGSSALYTFKLRKKKPQY